LAFEFARFLLQLVDIHADSSEELGIAHAAGLVKRYDVGSTGQDIRALDPFSRREV
jgi:hypothetical protein